MRPAVLWMGLLLACTAEAAGTTAAPSEDVLAPVAASTPVGTPPAAPVAPAADAPGSTAAPAMAAAPSTAGPTRAGPTAPAIAAVPAAAPTEAAAQDDGCVAHTRELAGVDAEDRRLQRGTVIVVVKAARRLMLFDDGERTHCFRTGLGFAPQGHKQREGDGRTPEGWYRTSDKPWSIFDHAIAIHYPNADDARAAAADGRIAARTRDRILADLDAGRVPSQSTKLGGAVLIHGGGSSADWTLGCVALDDADLLALRGALPKGMRTNLLVLP